MDLSARRRKIGNKIRELREKENWNQSKLGAELARTMGKPEPVSSAAISRYEEGKRSLKPEALEALAAVFKIKPSIFYDGASVSVSEPRGAYDAGTNSKRLAVIEEMPLSFPETCDRDIAGYAEFPRFMFPGAKYLIKVGDGFFCEDGLCEGDYLLVAPPAGAQGAEKLLYKNEGIFFVGHPSKKSAHPEIVGQVLGVIKKP